MSFEFNPVGYAETPYPEKFSIPRQPGLVTADQSCIRLEGKANREEILRGLDGFSHIWLVFVFHEAMRDDWKPMVRPPRLGGNRKVGVFASRSPFRPNPIGLSVVRVRDISQRGQHWCVNVEGCDLLNGTPILDIKPYLPYADSLDEAAAGFAAEAPGSPCDVTFSNAASTALAEQKHPQIKRLITEVLQQQPEPAYHRQQDGGAEVQRRIYGISLYNLNIRWRYIHSASPAAIEVIAIE